MKNMSITMGLFISTHGFGGIQIAGPITLSWGEAEWTEMAWWREAVHLKTAGEQKGGEKEI